MTDRRRLQVFLCLYRYCPKTNNDYQKNVCLAIMQLIKIRHRRLTYVFYKLIKEVINLVTLLEKKDRKKRSCRHFTQNRG